VSPPDRAVTIIGASGALGFGLAARLAAAGVAVTIGSRDAARAVATGDRVREVCGPDSGAIDCLTNAEAAAANEFVVLTVPFASHAATLAHIADTMRAGQLLIDATVPLATAVGGRPTRMLGVWQGSAAQQAQELAPEGVRVVGALHTVSATKLARLEQALDEDVLLVGDRRADKQRVAALLDGIPGLRCVDAGRLEMARIAESLTALMIAMNIRHHAETGIRVTGLPEVLW
jgi:NADPH-dependent F420 reductase